MKKLLVLMLVLGLASLANATVVYRYTSDSGGLSTITEVLTNTTFYLVVGGLVADMPTDSKIYDPDGQGGYADFTGTIILVDNGQGEDAAGNAITQYYDGGPTYDGWELAAYQITPVAPEGAIDGDWFIVALLSTGTEGTFNPNLLDSSYATIGSVGGINIIPEPMTMVLLGIGGLFLRRRKA